MKSFQIKTRVNFGDNALDRLAEVPYKKILIVTDPFMAKSKNLNLILDPIKKAGKEYDIFQDIVPDPPIEKISLGVKKMLEYKPDAIVAVGGGSAIDSSKSIREFALRVSLRRGRADRNPDNKRYRIRGNFICRCIRPGRTEKISTCILGIDTGRGNPRCRTCKECATGDYSRYRNGRIYTRT